MEITKLADALNLEDAPGAPRVPKYQRLSDGILRAIEAGELRSGDRLPGESELAQALPFSLGTVQKALSLLAERGAVVRRHGTGTFVAETPAQLPELWHFRFPADDGETLLPVFTRTVGAARSSAPGPWTDFLGGAAHIRIDREVDVNHEFLALSRIFLPAGRFASLLRDPALKAENVNIRALLRERFDAPTLRVVEQVGAETLPGDVAAGLGLAADASGLVVHIRGFGFRDAALSYQVVYVPPNTRRLEVQPKMP
ncbi:MAG: GntR family transcriptional regulator [Rhodospirillaceae bacterium]